MDKVTSKDGTIISFLKQGAGQPLLLVHGTTADHHRWLPLLSYFDKYFTVYVMDRRGRGGSGDSTDYNVFKEAEDIAAVIDSIGKPVSVLGHSYGALCSLEGAALTNNLNKLILYEPVLPVENIPVYPVNIMEKMQHLLEEDKKEAALELFFKKVVKMPDEEFEKYRNLPTWKTRIEIAPTILRESFAEEKYTFNPGKFAELKIPVLLLLGGDSPELFRHATEKVSSALPAARVVILPGQRHVAMDTNPELFVKEVLGFLL